MTDYYLTDAVVVILLHLKVGPQDVWYLIIT